MSCFCGECPYCRRPDSNLNIELAAAKADLESVKTHHRYDLEQFRKCQDENKRLREALEKINAIKNKMEGGDWDEIEEARDIAKSALDGNGGEA